MFAVFAWSIRRTKADWRFSGALRQIGLLLFVLASRKIVSGRLENLAGVMRQFEWMALAAIIAAVLVGGYWALGVQSQPPKSADWHCQANRADVRAECVKQTPP
jgi:hypothetical protein